MLDFVLLVCIGLGISTVLVRRSSKKGMDIDLTWLQSLKVVVVRTVVALVVGFSLGRLIFWSMQSGLLSESVLSEYPLVSVVVVLICGLCSFMAFQWITRRISGRRVSFRLAVGTMVYEIGYFVLCMLALFAILVLAGVIYEFIF